MSGKTLGQIGYEGFVAFQEPGEFEYETWADKDEHGDSATMGRADWEAAAQAVLKVGVCPHGDLAADLDQLRDRVARVAAALDADALATAPSKKSQIQEDAARRIREALA